MQTKDFNGDEALIATSTAVEIIRETLNLTHRKPDMALLSLCTAVAIASEMFRKEERPRSAVLDNVCNAIRTFPIEVYVAKSVEITNHVLRPTHEENRP